MGERPKQVCTLEVAWLTKVPKVGCLEGIRALSHPHTAIAIADAGYPPEVGLGKKEERWGLLLISSKTVPKYRET